MLLLFFMLLVMVLLRTDHVHFDYIVDASFDDDDDGVSALVAGGCSIRTARTYSTYGTVPEKVQRTYTFSTTTGLYGTVKFILVKSNKHLLYRRLNLPTPQE